MPKDEQKYILEHTHQWTLDLTNYHKALGGLVSTFAPFRPYLESQAESGETPGTDGTVSKGDKERYDKALSNYHDVHYSIMTDRLRTLNVQATWERWANGEIVAPSEDAQREAQACNDGGELYVGYHEMRKLVESQGMTLENLTSKL
ncbi:hypothetical protein I302_104896 [Kwoniella bestiolae CBS 10118]|uniref:Uncharacterized protein n=1 Tax=Kwoniella bestiolae CBS 10118 TaxID=1296100 RepID=A0A1B9FRF7_9TREE|nr:hypothetical protein I302_09033 [Kwoniella bestiolae CBS 10118]OCF21357.1 hypothetical protein I302_09033 [Kwoniella bestiolae CBS 10118]